MLIFKEGKFIKAPFENEAELEKVVFNNYEHLFGPDSFFLPKTLIKTADGAGTIPDGFAIDLAERKWYIVEAELGHHDVWNHIAKQVSKQIVASIQLATKQRLEDISADLYQSNEYLREKFTSLNITSVDVRKVVRDILHKDPIIGLPIDIVSNDLRDWAKQQKHIVKLWIIGKFVELNNSLNVVYEFPEEFKPELDTAQETEQPMINSPITRYDVEVIDLIGTGLLKVGDTLLMSYKPKNGEQKVYQGILLEDGSINVLNQAYSSPSYAALAGIKDAGSIRQTVNGWTSWKTMNGFTLADLREKYLNEKMVLQ